MWCCGGVVTQRSAKPRTPVQFRSAPPFYFMNRPIAIQGALQSEIDYFLDFFKVTHKTSVGNFVFYECIYQDYPIIISKTKIGEISSAIATTLLIQKYQPLFILNQGTAGASTEQLNRGDIVIGDKIYYISQFSTEENKEEDILNPWKKNEYRTLDNEHMSYSANPRFLTWLKSLEIIKKDNIRFGTIGSGDIWTKDAETIKKYNQDHDVVCEAMECSGAHIAANSLGTSIVSIRVIANNELKGQEYDETLGVRSQKIVIDIIDEYLKSI